MQDEGRIKRKARMTDEEKKQRRMRRSLIRMLVETEDVFGDIVVDRDGFAEIEREKLKRRDEKRRAEMLRRDFEVVQPPKGNSDGKRTQR